MTTRKLIAALAVALNLGCWSVGIADADDSLPASTNKVRSRVFNPFDVGFTRLSLDPFGIFTLSEPTIQTQMAQLQSNPFSTSSAGGSAASTSSTEAVTTTPPTTTTLTLSPLQVRPPFVPPDRSPFRPPPRPPFPP
jgi:hypothetical protein